MEETVEWRRLRLTRAGVLTYEVFCTPGREAYGGRIAGRMQRAEVRGVTADKKKMREWMSRMAKGRVRPCHLREILEELLAEREALS